MINLNKIYAFNPYTQDTYFIVGLSLWASRQIYKYTNYFKGKKV